MNQLLETFHKLIVAKIGDSCKSLTCYLNERIFAQNALAGDLPNLQKQCETIRSRSWFSGNQWLCCSTFRANVRI